MTRTQIHTIALHKGDLDSKFGNPSHAPAMFAPTCHPYHGMRMGYRDGVLMTWCKGCGEFVACIEVAK